MADPQPPLTLDQAHQALRHSPKARPWRLHFRFGYGNNAQTKEMTLLAPPDRGALVLLRLHNGLLLLQPASVRLYAPVEEAELEPLLGTLRGVHNIPITVNDASAPPFGERPLDVPAIEVRERPEPMGDLLALGLDIGGTGMKACAVRDGRIVRFGQAETWPEGERGLDSLVTRGRALIEKVREGEAAGSLGVGFASPMGVGGQVVGLSTVMQQRLGEGVNLSDLPARFAEGIVDGPLAFFNDLANLGRSLSGEGRRRLLRLQVGTSFGGCWIDADGTVNAAELGRLIIDARPDAREHTYLPLRGAMKSYLSNYGLALTYEEVVGQAVTARDVGFRWRDLNQAQDPKGQALLDWFLAWIDGVVAEARCFLPGLREVEIGGSMLQEGTGRALRPALEQRSQEVTLTLARDPGYDGALAAARAPLLMTPLRGLRRLG